MIFLMFLWLCTLMIFWFTHSYYLNIENMYEWYSNNYKKLTCNTTSKNASFTQLKSCILIWLFSVMILKWISWRLKQLLIKKVCKMFMIYDHFSDLWISIDDSYNTFQKLYNFLWTWQRKSQNFYEISHVNMYSIIWRNNSQLLQYLLISILILNAISKLTHSIMLRKMFFHNTIKIACYT